MSGSVVLVQAGFFFTREKTSRKISPNFRHASLKIFACPVLGWRSLENVCLKGAKLLIYAQEAHMSRTGPVTHGHRVQKKENSSPKLHYSYIWHLFQENWYFSLLIHIYLGDANWFVVLEIWRPLSKCQRVITLWILQNVSIRMSVHLVLSSLDLMYSHKTIWFVNNLCMSGAGCSTWLPLHATLIHHSILCCTDL
jgi:hypothetical protein